MIKDQIKCGFNISGILGNITKTHLRTLREGERARDLAPNLCIIFYPGWYWNVGSGEY